MKHNELLISNQSISKASAPFLRDCILPVFDELEDELVDVELEPFGIDEQLKKSNRQACALEIGGLVSILVFLGGWAATKVLDEIYDRKLGPVLRKHLSSYLSTRVVHQKYALSLVVGIEHTRVTLLIAAVGRTAAEVEASESHVRSVLSHAVKYAQDNSSTKEVHLYVVDGSRVDLRPQIFDRISSAMQALDGKSVKPLRTVRNAR